MAESATALAAPSARAVSNEMQSRGTGSTDAAAGIEAPKAGESVVKIALHFVKSKRPHGQNSRQAATSITLAFISPIMLAARAAFTVVSTIVALTALTGGCASTPAGALDRRAAQLGLEVGTIAGGEMLLRTYARPLAMLPATGTDHGRLHIYLDGDGRPFVRPGQVARDPTPGDPLTLKLLLADPARAIYLGRPCYHSMNQPCDARLWTTARYGELVVDSMAAAVTRIIDQHPATNVVLIGYSGGGVIAALIAERLVAVDTLVTIAANLDIDAWTAHHGYSPLAASHNPARMSGHRQSLQHLHWVGTNDVNVPPASQAAMRARVPHAEFRSLADFDHRCCWLETWPARLDEITALLRQSGLAPAPARADYRENHPSTSPAPDSP